MFKQVISLFFTVAISFACLAQKAEKVKGNRNVTIIQTDIDPFHTILLDEDFEIELIYNQSPSVIIETDENLHEFINFHVNDGVLTFDKTIRITSKKRLNITVSYDASLTNIRTIDDSEITAITSMDLANVLLITEGASKAGLTLKTTNFEFQSNGRSKVKLNLTCENAKLNLTDNSKIDALIYSPITKVDLYQRANATIEGETDAFELRTDNYSQFNGKNFTSKTCNTLNEMSSDAYLEVMDTVTIEASGSSSVYLYGNPQIIVNKLEDTSRLQKKLK